MHRGLKVRARSPRPAAPARRRRRRPAAAARSIDAPSLPAAARPSLQNYIQELRACATRDAERERVDRELGKIRKKYTSAKALSSYDRRKYMWKLLYTRMLGYDVEFGHRQAMDLMASTA